MVVARKLQLVVLWAVALLAAAQEAPSKTYINGNHKRHLEKVNDGELGEAGTDYSQEDIDFWTRMIDLQSMVPPPTPTRPPTLPPVPSPGAGPAPTRPPNPSPIADPTTTAPVSDPATTPPGPGDCETQASVTCTNENGVSCDEMTTPNGACNADGKASLETIRFRLEFCTCEESRNTQAVFLDSCTDEGLLPSGENDGATVRVTCAAVNDDSLLYSESVQEGDTIALEDLPDEIMCSIFTTDGDLLQVFIINTGGQVDLSLTEKFGSLSLEACDDNDCITEITYTYQVENTGKVPVVVTKFERALNGQTKDLLSNLSPTQIPSGSTGKATEIQDVDLCVGEEYFSVIEVVAVPPDGAECSTQADFFFPVLDGCLVDVHITCKTEDGVECQDLEARLNPADCDVEVCYEYEIENVGTGTMDITTMDRRRNDETISLVSELETTSLNPGQSTTVVEKEMVDLCSGAEFTTDIIVEADPPNENQCADEDMYKFKLSPPCGISLDMACTSLAGDPDCTDIQGEQSPTCNCDCVQELVYRYTAASCAAGLDDCADSGANELSADITISDGNTLLFEDRVQIDDDIVIRNGGECLPETLNALVSPTTGEQPASQVSIIDSACTGGITLLDNFGAFEFAGYTCSDNIPHSCYMEVEYNIVTVNGGTVPHTVTGWIFDLNGEVRGPGVELPVLEPNESFSKIESAEIELCSDGRYTAMADVTTVDDNGNECDDRQGLVFDINAGPPVTLPGTPPPSPSPGTPPPQSPSPGTLPPPTPSPGTPPPPTPSPDTPPPNTDPTTKCEFEMDIECVPPFGAPACNATPPPVEQCSGRPFEMGFLYNGGGCSQSWNVQEAEGKFFCTDFEGGPPTQRGDKSFIVVTDLEGDTIFHSDYVKVGSLFTLADGGSNFPANQLITIYKTNNTDDPNGVLQSVQYHSSCSSNLFLKDRFGASQLVLWVNEDQGIVSCFANQTFNLDITIPIDIVGGPATVIGLTVASNVDPYFFNLTEKVYGIEASAGEIIETSIGIPIDLTEKRTYTLLITLTAVTASGEQCTASELTSFTAGYPLPPVFPTFSPTQSPDSSP